LCRHCAALAERRGREYRRLLELGVNPKRNRTTWAESILEVLDA
jgi:hypothetical protein